MERTDFLKNACKYGLCGCIGMSILTGSDVFANSESTQDADKPDWRIDFMQSRYRDLIYILNDTLDKDTFIAVLKKLGSKCGDDFANKYKNNPEGFFNFIKSLWADTVDYDKEKGIIRVNEKIRNTCNCPFVRAKEAPGILCNCSLGTQKRIYESLFGRQVNVTLEKSVLRGDERCSFTIQLM
jgi:predicted ArsR family transcriptional regulator